MVAFPPFEKKKKKREGGIGLDPVFGFPFFNNGACLMAYKRARQTTNGAKRAHEKATFKRRRKKTLLVFGPEKMPFPQMDPELENHRSRHWQAPNASSALMT